MEGTPFETFRVEYLATISKDNAVLHTLLQFFPDRVLQVGLRGRLQEVNGAPKNLEVSHGCEVVDHMVLKVLKAIKLSNLATLREIFTIVPERAVDTK